MMGEWPGPSSHPRLGSGFWADNRELRYSAETDGTPLALGEDLVEKLIQSILLPDRDIKPRGGAYRT